MEIIEDTMMTLAHSNLIMEEPLLVGMNLAITRKLSMIEAPNLISISTFYTYYQLSRFHVFFLVHDFKITLDTGVNI